jgi:signal transduction histidine kinase
VRVRRLGRQFPQTLTRVRRGALLKPGLAPEWIYLLRRDLLARTLACHALHNVAHAPPVRPMCFGLHGRRPARKLKAGEHVDPAQVQMSLLQWLLEGAPFGVAWRNAAGPVSLNAKGATLLALDRREYLPDEFGSHVRALSTDGRAIDAGQNPLSLGLGGHRIQRARVAVALESGRRAQLSVSAFPLGSQPNAVGAVVVFEEISEAGETETRQADWLAALAHEMSGAIQLLVNSLAIAEKVVEREPPRARQYLATASHQLEILRRLIAGFIDAARLNAGALEVKPRAFRLRELMEEMVEAHELSDARHRILLEGEGEPWAHADPDRVRQILTNLLTNAAKYAVPGLLALGARDDGERVLLWLRDEGPGIPEAQQSSLFQRFHRLPSYTHGSGMGLWMSRQLAERMGGALWVHSGDGRPSTFFVALPAARPEQPPRAA